MMPAHYDIWRVIAAKQKKQAAAGLNRQRQVLTPTIKATELHSNSGNKVDFSGNDYLGLAQHQQVINAVCDGVKRYGASSSASPLIAGYSAAHRQLEAALCRKTGHEAALLFSSGFSANTALMTSLFDHAAVVIADKRIHASIIDGVLHSKAKLRRFLHNDMTAAAQLIKANSGSVVITESVFSMDGDTAPLMQLSALCQQYSCPLIIDDAHGFGLYPLPDIKVFAQIVTFGKALGGQGAAILGSQQLISFLVANAREYIYSTALAPATCCGVIAALSLLETTQLTDKLQQNIAFFRSQCKSTGIELTPSTTAIQPIIIGDSATTMAIAADLATQGFLVGAIRPPTVSQGTARLRITLSAAHEQSQIHALVEALSTILTRYVV